jgi:hypothetical protein
VIDFQVVVYMVSRVLMIGVLLVLATCTAVARDNARSIEGTYRNPALGYSIQIPVGLRGVAGDEAGPERGVGVLLPSGGKIVVFGEPNSLEWKSPEDGVRAELTDAACISGEREVEKARVGTLSGAKGRLVCGNRVLRMLIVLRPGGGPIYCLRLETVRAHELGDGAILESIAASFRLIRWE